jgi:hypothetical protein
MSAARRKGKWVGGTPVLGYDVDPGGGRLIVNDKESRQVLDIFALFVQHRSLSKVVAELAQRRWKTKSWKSQNGTAHTHFQWPADPLSRAILMSFLRAEFIRTLFEWKIPSSLSPIRPDRNRLLQRIVEKKYHQSQVTKRREAA